MLSFENSLRRGSRCRQTVLAVPSPSSRHADPYLKISAPVFDDRGPSRNLKQVAHWGSARARQTCSDMTGQTTRAVGNKTKEPGPSPREVSGGSGCIPHTMFPCFPFHAHPAMRPSSCFLSVSFLLSSTGRNQTSLLDSFTRGGSIGNILGPYRRRQHVVREHRRSDARSVQANRVRSNQSAPLDAQR